MATLLACKTPTGSQRSKIHIACTKLIVATLTKQATHCTCAQSEAALVQTTLPWQTCIWYKWLGNELHPFTRPGWLWTPASHSSFSETNRKLRRPVWNRSDASSIFTCLAACERPGTVQTICFEQLVAGSTRCIPMRPS